jgi:hypothetical protein
MTPYPWPGPSTSLSSRIRNRGELLLSIWWREPAPPQRWVLGAALAFGLLAALVLPGAPQLGVNLGICGLAAAIPLGLLARAEGRRRGRSRPVGRVATALGIVAVLLSGVAAVRASEWLAAGCALAAFALATAITLDARRWDAVITAVPLFGLAVFHSLPWAGRLVRLHNLRSRSLPWLNGLAIGLAVTVAVAALLASADEAFASAVGVGLSFFSGNLAAARILAFGAGVGTMLGGAYAISIEMVWPRAQREASASKSLDQKQDSTPEATTAPQSGTAAQSSPAKHPVEWLLPLVLVAATIAAFLAVEATQLFGGADVVHTSALSHADRAHQGFGQLTVVTLIVVALLSWAGSHARRGPASHRWMMAGAGGLLLVLTTLLGASALRRLSLYQEAYGWTVTRLVAGAFEIWVVVVLIAIAIGWLARRTDLLPRLVIGSAGLGLLVVALAGPDALVADGNVHRFTHPPAGTTAKIDLWYLSSLSADAVPALDRLPEPQRSCVLSQQTTKPDPWYGWNLARSRADHILKVRPVQPGDCPGFTR